VAKPKLETVLASVPIFEDLSKKQLKKVAAVSELVEYMQKHSIVREGDVGDSFFVVLRGQANVTTSGKVVSKVMPGDHFGEISLLDGGPRTATVTSDTPMTMLILSRKAFLKCLTADPEMAMALMKTMARMIRRVDRSIAR
jgi:CRP/FNR family transcriptional regulator, cyclic AMP receptor protein